MRTFSNSYVSRVLFAVPPFNEPRRLHRRGASLFEPYRPELHYMHGAGLKWRKTPARGISQRIAS
jgi:hypothetical protein